MEYTAFEVNDMQNQTQRDLSVKYTAVLPRACVEGLKSLTENKIIPSVNQGIRLAIEDFVAAHRQREYELSLQAAASDQAFLQRTLDAQEAFADADADGDAGW
jgi:hypothetical protein